MSRMLFVDVRKGHVIDDGGKLLQVIERDLRTPGNLPSKLSLTVKNLKTGYVNEIRVHPEDKAEIAYLETRTMSYLYRDGADYVFMDMETYDQMSFSLEVVDDLMLFIKENDEVQVTFYEGNALQAVPPPTVTLKVTETEPSIKGATAAAQYKQATLETGLQIAIPSFVVQGESVLVDTVKCEYAGRAK